MVEGFEHFIGMWKEQTKDIKIRKEYNHLLFLVVCPDKVKDWDFSIEKQCQTTTFMVSGGPTGASTGHDVQFCYRKEVNKFLKNCKHTHAMVVSIGMVFDMVGHNQGQQITPITDFYNFAESGEYIKGHIIAKKRQSAYLHHQHMNVNVDMWKTLGCPPLDEKWLKYERSDNNFHDDYTPFWLTPKDRPKIINFTIDERRRKSFSYYRNYNDAWIDIENIWNYVDKDDFYFSRFMTRIQESFYMFNTESVQRLPKKKFDLLFSPTAGYSAEVYVDRLDFNGEVILYDYCQENVDLKQMVVDMNMSKDELYILRESSKHKFVDNTGNKPATERSSSMGTHEELREMQARMRDKQEIEYWLMDIIEPDYTVLLNKIRGKNVFFDTSNIFSYHVSHARYTLAQLIDSYERLHEILGYANSCWFQGTKPTKQWERKWLTSSVLE